MKTTTKLFIDNCPEELKDYKQWVFWVKEGDKKLPLVYHVAEAHLTAKDWNNPKHWMTFQEAVDLIEMGVSDFPLNLGFVFTPEDPFVFIDIDHYKEEAHKTVAAKLLNACEGYAEVSQSGQGLHLIVKAKKSSLLTRSKFVECYDHNRFCALTFNSINNKKEVTEGQHLVDAIESWFKKNAATTPPPGEPEAPPPLATTEAVALSDDEIIAKCEKAKNSKKFHKLFHEGDTTAYASSSEAVVALIGLLSFYTIDHDQLDRIFKRSGLWAGKWKEEKWERLRDKIFARIQKNRKDSYTGDKKSKKQATLEEYIKTFKSIFGDKIRRDLFSGEAHVYYQNRWTNVFNRHITNHYKAVLSRDPKFSVHQAECILSEFQHTLKPELLLDIPKWDGLDRVGDMCKSLQFSDDRLSPETVRYYIMRWGNTLWRKIDTFEENKCIIFCGPQGIGKDFFIETLVKGLGMYHTNLTLDAHPNEKELAHTITQSIAVVISEFDKLKGLGSASIKDLISKPFFHVRLSYEREARRIPNRASFIAAANPDDLFTDVTGNRRFVLVRLKGIDWTYSRGEEESLQIAAQFMQDITAKDDRLEALMAEIIDEYTPVPNESIICALAQEFMAGKICGKMASKMVGSDELLHSAEQLPPKLFSHTDLKDLWLELKKQFPHKSVQQFPVQLAMAQMRVKSDPKGMNYYGLPGHVEQVSSKARKMPIIRRRDFLRQIYHGAQPSFDA